MPERTEEELRAQIASERVGLARDLNALGGQARSLLAFVVAGAVALVLLFQRRHLTSGAKFLWRLR